MRRDYAADARHSAEMFSARRKSAPVACALEDRAAELDLTLPWDATQARQERDAIMFHLSQYQTFDIPNTFRAAVVQAIERLERLANGAKDLDVLESYAASKESK